MEGEKNPILLGIEPRSPLLKLNNGGSEENPEKSLPSGYTPSNTGITNPAYSSNGNTGGNNSPNYQTMSHTYLPTKDPDGTQNGAEDPEGTQAGPETPLTTSVSMPDAYDGKQDVTDIAVQAATKLGTKWTRLMRKNGHYNMDHIHAKGRFRSYMNDIFTTIMRQQWYYTMTMYCFFFLFSWVMFAFIWWIIAYANGDLNIDNSDDHPMCVTGVVDFTTALLFSIETQQTIGYGTRAVTDNCKVSLIILTIQSLIGDILECVMTGIIFAKLARPLKRARTIMFTKKAVITMMDGKKCLMFRLADMRRSGFVDANIKALVMTKEDLPADRKIIFRSTNFNIEPETEDRLERIHIEWPIRIVHYIDKDSPFYGVTEETLPHQQFEIIVILEGTIESTGMVTQVRTSYVPSEILWGHQFLPLINEPKLEGGKFKVDYRVFDKTVPLEEDLKEDSLFVNNH